MRVGFPHSDIFGSKLVCQLPEAFRRLPRPSSPVIAKASTTCTYSLDPITLRTSDIKTGNIKKAISGFLSKPSNSYRYLYASIDTLIQSNPLFRILFKKKDILIKNQQNISPLFQETKYFTSSKFLKIEGQNTL